MAPSRAPSRSLLVAPLLAALLLSSITVAAAGFNQSASIDKLLESSQSLPSKGSPEYLALFRKEVQEYNDLILKPLLPASLRSQIPHEVQIYVRNLLSGLALYYATGGLWCVYVYGVMGKHFFPKGSIPKAEDMWKQIAVSTKAMPLYVLMPTVSELMIERGWTRCYARVEEYGWAYHLLLAATYMTVVEFGVYWMHRGLHEIKWAYKLLHATHHIYNKQNTLSPFAGLAFNPIDGMLQASPYVFALFLVPMHFFTHELLLFMTAVWTTNIHDCIDGQVWPVMGAGYHTIHHTTYKHNYGHYTVWMDWMCGTLRTPPRDPASEKEAGPKRD